MTGFQWLIVWSVVVSVAFYILAMTLDSMRMTALWMVMSTLVGAAVFSIGWSGYFLQRQVCEEKTAAMRVESRYDSHTGCLIHDEDREIPLENWMRNEESSR